MTAFQTASPNISQILYALSMVYKGELGERETGLVVAPIFTAGEAVRSKRAKRDDDD